MTYRHILHGIGATYAFDDATVLQSVVDPPGRTPCSIHREHAVFDPTGGTPWSSHWNTSHGRSTGTQAVVDPTGGTPCSIQRNASRGSTLHRDASRGRSTGTQAVVDPPGRKPWSIHRDASRGRSAVSAVTFGFGAQVVRQVLGYVTVHVAIAGSVNTALKCWPKRSQITYLLPTLGILKLNRHSVCLIQRNASRGRSTGTQAVVDTPGRKPCSISRGRSVVSAVTFGVDD